MMAMATQGGAERERDFTTDLEKWRSEERTSRLFVVLSSSICLPLSHSEGVVLSSCRIVAGRKTEKGRKHGDKRVSGRMSVLIRRRTMLTNWPGSCFLQP